MQILQKCRYNTMTNIAVADTTRKEDHSYPKCWKYSRTATAKAQQSNVPNVADRLVLTDVLAGNFNEPHQLLNNQCSVWRSQTS